MLVCCNRPSSLTVLFATRMCYAVVTSFGISLTYLGESEIHPPEFANLQAV